MLILLILALVLLPLSTPQICCIPFVSKVARARERERERERKETAQKAKLPRVITER
jgi:hypothetical protein